ncbi:acetyl/propionyl/methylcrotonyl-CoA carboxylase subunit alpha [Herbidospora mongoliensis]|uniref:acetyl/propionyl/methylcrotonyl-CoA carboxylase subunit alpha n=1 Tax=Herbidospora mongoliensis TaxID=688067 RepID=UPI00082E0A25|nr:biotin carboxylase N-terminal domain-containing protein [Herbidospora mongoliensis]
MIRRVLVANRGEIARRVIRACDALGIETVAVFSDADAGSRHVAEAGSAVRLSKYTDVEKLVSAARAAGADAVHPGYGFLSEDAGFARAVIEAGLTWIGPSPEAIAAMGDKIEAKALMAEAGVPLLPTLAFGGAFTEPPADLTYPLLLKASAGGGGRGMRIVRSAEELAEALESAGREAAAAFGDGTMFAEPLLEQARHVEVQILADTHGTVWALGERECSIQRRHQKVLEEAPSPGVTPELRRSLAEAAVNAARAIGYTGAGTVEFLLADGQFHFLEMNTRLQVEHPVTEAVYGVDLVRLQIEIAEGAALPGLPPSPVGHAIEVRLYAENPADGWNPQSGTMHRFEVPGVEAEFGEGGLRLDSGIVSGDEIGTFYDPMLAKVIAYAPTREAAARRLATALAFAKIHGPTTNRDLLVRVLRHPEFLQGMTDTGFLTRHGLPVEQEPDADARQLFAPLAGVEAVRLSALAAALAQAAKPRRTLGDLPTGWRNVVSQPHKVQFAEAGEITYLHTRDGLKSSPEATFISASEDEVVLEISGVRRVFDVAFYDGAVYVDSSLGPVRLTPLARLPVPVVQTPPGSLPAPMPGTVLRVEVGVGDEVKPGQTVVVLEAMKMEHRITAPAEGVVAELTAVAGRQVDAGTTLAVIKEVTQ